MDWQKKSSGGLPIIRIQNLNNPNSDFNYFTGDVLDKYIIQTGELLFSWSGSRATSFGAHIWKGKKAVLNLHIFKVQFDADRTDKQYLFYILNKAVARVLENLHGGVGLVHITKENLGKINIPLPPLDIQEAIVAEIDGYQKIIDEDKEHIKVFEQKIKDKVSEVWREQGPHQGMYFQQSKPLFHVFSHSSIHLHIFHPIQRFWFPVHEVYHS